MLAAILSLMHCSNSWVLIVCTRCLSMHMQQKFLKSFPSYGLRFASNLQIKDPGGERVSSEFLWRTACILHSQWLNKHVVFCSSWMGLLLSIISKSQFLNVRIRRFICIIYWIESFRIYINWYYSLPIQNIFENLLPQTFLKAIKLMA